MKTNTIVLSIHPCHVEKILNGEKKYEFRKKIPKHIKYIFIYSTSPVKEVSVVIEVGSILTDTVDNIWNKTFKNAGITHAFYKEYFKNRDYANAIKINKVHKLKQPIMIGDLVPSNYAPQSYVYIQEGIKLANTIVSKTLFQKISTAF